MEKGSLTERDHSAMDRFLGTVLDAYKADQVDRANAVSQLAQVIAAIDIRNIGEARAWFAAPYPPEDI